MAAPQNLYHYTSQAGLLGILQRRVLYASSIRHLNDAAEMSYAISVLEKSLAQINQPRTRIWTEFAQRFYDYIQIIENSEAFVVSFSQERDQLSQWRAYTGGGVGFSIGLNLGMLQSFASAQGFKLERCSYLASEHSALTNSVLRKAKTTLEEKGEAGIEEAAVRCMTEFMNFAPRLKHPSFVEEKEWRLIRVVDTFEEQTTKFRVGKSMLVPYEEFTFVNEDDNTPVVEIVVGPAPHMDLSKLSVERLLMSLDMAHVAVLQSAVPFRDW